MKLLVECSLKRTWRGNKIVKLLLLLFCIEEWLTKILDNCSRKEKYSSLSLSVMSYGGDQLLSDRAFMARLDYLFKYGFHFL